MPKITMGLKAHLVISSLLIMILSLLFFINIDPHLTPYEFVYQDRYVAVSLFFAMILAIYYPRYAAIPGCLPSPWLEAIMAFCLVAIVWAGTYAVMGDYPWTLDEVMARLDADIIRRGHLALHTPPEWRAYVKALFPYFLLDTPHHDIIVSTYLPVNAALRAAAGWVGASALVSPLLTGVGLILLGRLAGREFPQCPQAVIVVMAGYCLSPQILVSGMTSYAMTAHLTMNLAWLTLFRRGDRVGLAGALLIGFLATGLHQIAFHPLFALPFILTLANRQDWRKFLVYLLAYGGILLFWMDYQHMVVLWEGVSLPSGSSGATTGGWGFLTSRIVPLVVNRDPYTLALMDKNLLRALCWNAAFLLPFAMMAWPAIRRGEGMARPLAGGIALTLAVVALVLPDQGHGWGYRYVQGVLGNALLLAGHGYWLSARREPLAADRAVWCLGGFTLVFAIPFLLGAARSFITPAMRLSALIERQQVDFVILDTMRPSTAIKQVRNRPDLSNRPLVFSSYDLGADQVAELCRRGTVALVDRAAQQSVGFSPWLPRRSPDFEALTASLRGKACLEPVRFARNERIAAL